MLFFLFAYVLRAVMGGLYYCIGCFAQCVVDVWKWGQIGLFRGLGHKKSRSIAMEREELFVIGI